MRSGIFRNEEETASSQGHFVHVYIDEAPIDLYRPFLSASAKHWSLSFVDNATG